MMELWYSELHTEDVKLSMRVKEHLYTARSLYQKIDVMDTWEFGHVLLLDDVVMLSDKDEFVYHEMITHVPMAVNPDIKDILVIGAGDGGTITRLLQYKTIKKIIVVEIDPLVVEVSKKYFPDLASNFDDERVELHYADGLKYVRQKVDAFDLIIVDSTDPFGPGEGLFTKEFYGNCYKALRSDGILVNQQESPYYEDDAKAMQRAHQRITSCFPIARVYQAHIPTYPSGHWLFGFASKGREPCVDVSAWNALNIATQYYNTQLHQGCFALPNFVKKLLEDTNEK